ncbi:hypothetical protein, partial [Streptomyces sp. NPDC005167]
FVGHGEQRGVGDECERLAALCGAPAPLLCPARAGTLSVCRTMDWTRKPWTYASWSGNRASSYV